MTPRDLATVLLRCLGIFVLVDAVSFSPHAVNGAVGALAAPNQLGLFVAITVGFALRFALGYWLIRAAPTLAARIAPAAGVEQPAMAPALIQSSLIAVLGLYLAASALPELVGQAYSVYFLSTLGSSTPCGDSAVRTPIGSLGPGVVRLLVGVSLFLWAQKLSRFWWRQAGG
jgi:hypothetical protein